jgi:hypothetical protein
MEEYRPLSLRTRSARACRASAGREKLTGAPISIFRRARLRIPRARNGSKREALASLIAIETLAKARLCRITTCCGKRNGARYAGRPVCCCRRTGAADLVVVLAAWDPTQVECAVLDAHLTRYG